MENILEKISKINDEIKKMWEQDSKVGQKFGKIELNTDADLGLSENVSSLMIPMLELFEDLNIDGNEKIKETLSHLKENDMIKKLGEAIDNKCDDLATRNEKIRKLQEERDELCEKYSELNPVENIFIVNTMAFKKPHKVLKEFEMLVKDSDMKFGKIGNYYVFQGDKEELSKKIKKEAKYLKSVANDIANGNYILRKVNSMKGYIYHNGELKDAEKIVSTKKSNSLKMGR